MGGWKHPLQIPPLKGNCYLSVWPVGQCCTWQLQVRKGARVLLRELSPNGARTAGDVNVRANTRIEGTNTSGERYGRNSAKTHKHLTSTDNENDDHRRKRRTRNYNRDRSRLQIVTNIIIPHKHLTQKSTTLSQVSTLS